jgi:flagellar protein FliO/FliZ
VLNGHNLATQFARTDGQALTRQRDADQSERSKQFWRGGHDPDWRMLEVVSWLLFIAFIAGLIVVAGMLLRGYLAGGGAAPALGGTLFQSKPDRRLDVVEQTTVDGRRKLLLIRRDNVEHLVMTGGPTDIVLETGIDTRTELRKFSEKPAQGGDSVVQPRFKPRRIGQAVND